MLKDPLEKKRLSWLNITAVILFLSFPVLSYFYRGIDFAIGTFIGSSIVALNFFLSQRLIGKIIEQKTFSLAVIVSYFVKFGVSVLVVYLAVVKYEIDSIGIMVGLSAIVVSTLLSTFLRTFQK